jgi:hypothetical protein
MDGISWRTPGLGVAGIAAPRPEADVQALAGQLTALHRMLRAPMHDAMMDQLADTAEALTQDLAALSATDADAMHDKARVLLDRLHDMLDATAPAEATTLTLMQSLVRDLARLARG